MAVCKACDQPLVLELHPDNFDEATSSAAGGLVSTVPDDVELMCGCHFHWQCLLDESTEVASDLNCPKCATTIAQGDRIPVNYTNEGGLQSNHDILPTVREEAYLEANPSARPARAFLTFCAEGDVLSIVEMMQDLLSEAESEDTEEAMKPAVLLRYQDPLNGQKGAMHLAIENKQIEVVWLLLWIASELPDHAFPANVRAQAGAWGATRNMVGPGPDVRGLRDERGLDAQGLANVVGYPWMDFVNAGFFAV